MLSHFSPTFCVAFGLHQNSPRTIAHATALIGLGPSIPCRAMSAHALLLQAHPH